MIYLIKYRVRRVTQSPCCRRVFYTWLREEVEASSESEAIQKIEERPDVMVAELIK